MKWKFLLLILSMVIFLQAGAQTLTVKKTCECTFDGNISSSVRFSASTFVPGKAYKAYVKATNVGTCGWGDNEVELRVKVVRCPSGSACQRDEFIPNRFDSNEDYINPREYEEFIYDWEAPAYTGKFNIQYQLYYQGKPFGDPIITTIEISPPK